MFLIGSLKEHGRANYKKPPDIGVFLAYSAMYA